MTRSGKPSLVTLMLLISFASVGAVLYTPALPAIADHFGISVVRAQMTVTYYLIGYALGMLPYGPLLNALGRKPTIYLGCCLGIAGSILCILAGPTGLFWLLDLGRFVMALGMAVGMVSTFTLIADSMGQKEAHRATSLVTLAFGIMPGVSIVIGGFLTEHLGWASCFYFIAAYCLLVLILAIRLPTTGATLGLHALHPLRVAKAYWRQATMLSVLLGGIILGSGSGVIYLFAAKAPFIGITVLGFSADDYGLLMLIPATGAVCGSLLSAYLSHRIVPRRIVWGGIIIMAISVVVPLLAFALGTINLWTLFFPIAFCYIGLMLCMAAISASVTSEATDKSNASAAISFLNMGVTAVAVLVGGVVSPKSVLMLPVFQMMLVGIIVTCNVIYVWLHRPTRGAAG